MHLPPRYNFMQYAFAQNTAPIQPAYQQQQQYQPQPFYGKYPAYVQRLGFNRNYLKSALSWFRILLIPSLIATLIASALCRNTEFAVRTESAFDNSVWISTLVFATVALIYNAIVLLAYMCNVPNVDGFKYTPWTILLGLVDVAFGIALLVLGIFCAIREARHLLIGGDYRNRSLNRGAFGVSSAFALLSALLFFLSALVHLLKRKAPLRPFYGNLPHHHRYR